VIRAAAVAAACRAGTPAGSRAPGIPQPASHDARCRGNGCHGDDDVRVADRAVEGGSGGRDGRPRREGRQGSSGRRLEVWWFTVGENSQVTAADVMTLILSVTFATR